jgi:hypothetical protein
MSASAFAITASARSIAARNSSLFQVSTECPSSNELSVASCARDTNSRSAAMASESSWASVSLREDCITYSSCAAGTLKGWHFEPYLTSSADTRGHRHNGQVARQCGACSNGGLCGLPVPWQQFIETIDVMPLDHPLQHVAEVGIGLDDSRPTYGKIKFTPPHRRQAIGTACLPAGASVGARAARGQKPNDSNIDFGTRALPLFGRADG